MENENIIIEKAKEGDKDALRILVENYSDTIYNFAFKMCRNKDKAENTMQETFFNMIKSLDQFDGKSKFSTWLYKIVANNCFMQHRVEKKFSSDAIENEDSLYSDVDRFDIEVLPDLNLENNELKQVLDETIKKLPEDYRMVFVLRDIQELSIEETSQITGLSISNVKTRLHRARKFLKNELTKVLEL